MDLTTHALTLLRETPDYVSDARRFAPIGNSVIGSIMSLTLGAPRQYTERAVCEALALLQSDGASSRPIYRTYRQMSGAQHGYAAYVAANPGCCVADVDRACRRNPRAGHKWVYDGVARLVREGVLRAEHRGREKRLFVVGS